MWYFSFKASILFLLWWSSVHSLPISSTTSFYFIVCWIHRSPAIRTPLSHLATLINMPVTTNQLILIQGFSFYLYKLTFGYGTHLSLLCLEAVFCLSGTNIPYSSCFVLIFPSPLSFFYPVFVFYSPFFPPLGQINLLCAENFLLVCLGQIPAPSTAIDYYVSCWARLIIFFPPVISKVPLSTRIIVGSKTSTWTTPEFPHVQMVSSAIYIGLNLQVLEDNK